MSDGRILNRLTENGLSPLIIKLGMNLTSQVVHKQGVNKQGVYTQGVFSWKCDPNKIRYKSTLLMLFNFISTNHLFSRNISRFWQNVT